MLTNDFIGVFDSGVGGISVLRALTRQLPKENYIYFGDSAHAPYGEKTTEEVQELSLRIVERFVEEGAKAIVIACNTATSAAAETVRARYPDLPILGVEPAVKPAAAEHERILIMATDMTLKLKKFRKLLDSLEGSAKFYPVVCTGLAKRIEQGNLDGEDLLDLLHQLLDSHKEEADCVVLGCTHYPFVKKQIQKVLGDLPMYDGAEGTARHLEAELIKRGCLNPQKEKGTVLFRSSLETKEELELYRKMYHHPSF